MASANELLDLLNCTIRFNTPEGEYEGVIRRVISSAEIIIVGKLILLPDRRMGTLNFRFSELANIRVINRPDSAQETSAERKDVLPVYPKTEIEKLFDFDEGSDIEDGEFVDNRQATYEMKLVPRLSKFVPKDFEIIDSFNKDFSLAIKHIRQQDAIGMSLEGIEISRSGTLTWISIATPCCTFLFDFLSLGKDVFKKGLKSILENARIQKIFHDCRLASDCLYHKYGVRLVNVFDTQVADFIVMMQIIQKDKINNRVNTLDACLNYYLEVPYDYLYGNANFDTNKDSLNFHALRPLQHEIQDVLIKNVMYLHLLKRELELALLTPLRRATDVYLNSIQKLKESEVLVVPHKPDELPLDMHLEGIQIFRYKDFEYACSTVASGPPYREINNPIKNYLNYRAEYKNGQKEDKESIVNKVASQNAKVTSSELNYKASVNYRKASKSKSEMRQVSVGSFDRSNESDQECSDDSERNQRANCHETVEHKFKTNPSVRAGNGSNTSVSQKSIVKSEASQFNKSTAVKNPIMRGMLELLSRTSKETVKNVKDTSDELSRVSKYNSQTSKETSSVDNEAVTRDSSNANELSNSKFASNPPKAAPSQIQRPTLGRRSPSELLELISLGMGSLNPLKAADASSDENFAKDSIATSESVCKDDNTEIDAVETISNAELVENHSDSNLEDIAARVRARGALLRNHKSASHYLSTSDSVSGRAEVKPIKESGKYSSGNVEPTSEDVTIYYSDMLDKPSQFVVKVNHKSSCLADLYKKAGDGNLLWTEEDSENVPKSSPNKPCESAVNDNFWDSILGDLPRKPIDEKLRSRLVPAGMWGY
ncbi:piRNA biogenesis protein EXD1 [Araneus ventricosus]|uniref:PiRNA biogenesis protein EXD1 n=1 Tax=Araneus ventricosus TaxID=182803 RepID=A0A4Y2DLR6_ARAVE|nr:piRNA biogenesis protein EXD1 [Araneus ventricosus]